VSDGPDLAARLQELERLLDADVTEQAVVLARDVLAAVHANDGEQDSEMGHALYLAAVLHRRAGQLEEARQLFAQCARHGAASRDQRAAVEGAASELQLAGLDLAAEDFAAAGGHLQTAQERGAQIEARWQPAPNVTWLRFSVAAQLAAVALHDGDADVAHARLRDALRLVGVEPAGGAGDLIAAAVRAAEILAANDSIAAGSLLLQQLAAHAAAAGNRVDAARALLRFGAICEHFGFPDEAYGAYRAGFEALGDEAGSRPDLARADIADKRGEFAAAAGHYRQAVLLRERVLPPGHLEVLRSRYNVAELARVTGDIEFAAGELQEVVDALRRSGDPEALSLRVLATRNLGNALLELRRPEAAEQAFADALALAPADDRVARAKLLFGLGNARRALHQPAGVVAELEQLAEGIGQEAGTRDPTYLWLRHALGTLLHDEDPDRAERMYQELIGALGSANLEAHASLLGATLANLAGLRLDRGDPQGAFAAFADSLPLSEAVRAEQWRVRSVLENEPPEPWLLKSPMLDLVVGALSGHDDARRLAFRAALGSKRLQAEALVRQRDLVLEGQRELQEVRDLAISQRRAAAGRGDPHRGPGQVDIADVEAALARAVPRTVLQETFSAGTVEKVAASLPADCILVEYVWCEPYETSSEGQGASGRDAPWYAAFVLPAGRPQDLAVVDLGDAGPIDQAVEALRAAIPSSGRGISARPEAPQPGVDWRTPARAAATLVWDPVAALLPTDDEDPWAIVAPDGALCALPFDALLRADGLPLVATATLTMLATGRDAARLEERANWATREAVVVAAPDFGAPGAPFSPLPGTVAEGQRVAGLLDVDPLMGPEATREMLLGVTDPEILHLATHGYYLDPDESTPAQPLLDSGVALTEANSDPAAGTLTALEALGLHLYGTDLVTLSACETGLGRPDQAEGLVGLGRSFLLAGARSVVSTLWMIDDESTATLMERFYRRLLSEMPRARALGDVKRGWFAEEPERPDLWAAFVLQGDRGQLLRYTYLLVPQEQLYEEPATVMEEKVFLANTEGRPWSMHAAPIGGGDPLRFAQINLRNLNVAQAEEAYWRGDTALRQQRWDEAENHYREALGHLPDEPRAGRALAASVYARLAITASAQGRLEDGRRHGLEALRRYEALEGYEDEIAVVLDNLGVTEYQLNQLDVARKRFERALALKRRVYPFQQHSQIDFTLNALAALDQAGPASASPPSGAGGDAEARGAKGRRDA
jgi:tetratricopeptide (TPR) repeat protein